MPRQTRQQIDDEILDTAATLFARHGLQETSIQRIADAAGFSKSGLLRHYPSKEALQDAVVSQCLTEVQAITAGVADQSPGPDRDRAALTGFAQFAFRRPGFVALMLWGLLHGPIGEGAALQPLGDALMAAFGVPADVTEPPTTAEVVRAVHVIAALGALAVPRIALLDVLPADAVGHLIDVSYAALGHPGPAAF